MLQIKNMKDDKILHRELSYKINGIFFRAHNNFGRFCRERQYCEELEKLFKESDISYEREYYIKTEKDKTNSGNVADFLIENKIILEIKAKDFISKEDYNQTKRYLHSSNIDLGLIVNFRNKYLKPKRVLNTFYS